MPTKHTRTKILREANKLFAKRGFEGVSMADLAIRSGIQKASLYYFFKNKDQLYVTTQEHVWQEIVGLLDSVKQKMLTLKRSQQRLLLIDTLERFVSMVRGAGRGMLDCADSREHASRHKQLEPLIATIHQRLLQIFSIMKLKQPRLACELVSLSLHMYVMRSRHHPSHTEPHTFISYMVSIL